MKTKGMKKLLAALISAVMTIGVIAPLGAFAAGNSITITSAEDDGSVTVNALLTGEAVTGTAIAAVYGEDNELLAVQSKDTAAEVEI